jgi:hypothetical protein
MSEKHGYNSLHAEERIGEKECLEIINTAGSAIIARLDITVWLPERDTSTRCALHMASGETLLILNKAFQKLTPGRRKLATWEFFLTITDEFILRLDVMHTQDSSVDFRRHVVGLGDEKVPLRCPGGATAFNSL